MFDMVDLKDVLDQEDPKVYLYKFVVRQDRYDEWYGEDHYYVSSIKVDHDREWIVIELGNLVD